MLEPTAAPSTPPIAVAALRLWAPELWPIAAPMPPPMRAPRSGSPAEACVERVVAATAAVIVAIIKGFFNIAISFVVRTC
jgi:hypothetical protein